MVSLYMVFLMPVFAIIIVLGIVVVKVFRIKKEYKNSKYGASSGNSLFRTINDKGNHGEFLTFQYLEKLDADNKILTNVYIPRSDGTTTEIDLLMLNKTGIYVFESKNYSGWIFGDEKSKNWTQTLEGGKKNKFYNPIWQNKTHITALKKVINDVNPNSFYSYIVFSERCELKKVSVSGDNIAVVKRNKLYDLLKEDIESRSRVLSDEQLDRLFESLKKYTLADSNTKLQHIESIRNKA